MELYAGLDLHSRNTYIGIMDKVFNRVFKKRVPNHLEQILQTLNPFRYQIKGLDACRNNPFPRKFRSTTRGLAVMDAPTGSLLAYSTAPGSVASDGQNRNGLYTL